MIRKLFSLGLLLTVVLLIGMPVALAQVPTPLSDDDKMYQIETLVDFIYNHIEEIALLVICYVIYKLLGKIKIGKRK